MNELRDVDANVNKEALTNGIVKAEDIKGVACTGQSEGLYL